MFPTLLGMLLVSVLLVPAAALHAGEEDGAGDEEPVKEGGLSEETLTPEELRRRVERWLADLSSSEFTVRDAARKALLTHGTAARDLLEARRDDEDPEVRRTVRLLLDRLGRPGPEAPSAPQGDPELLGRISLEARGTLPFLLARIGEAHGATFDLPESPQGLAEVFYELKLAEQPFFAALDVLLAKAQLAAPGPFDAGGRLKIQGLDEVDDVPSAAAGPMRVRVVEVTSVRALSPQGGRRYMVAIDLQWTPAVQVRQWQTPADLEAEDAEGRAYRPGSAMRAHVTYGTSQTARRARLNLHLEPDDPEASEHLATLSFKLPVTLWYDRYALRFGPVAGLEMPARMEISGEGTDPGDHVTLRSFDEPTTERGPYTVDLLARLTEKAAQDSLSVSLEQADGSVHVANAGSRFPSSDGTVGLRARAWLRNGEPPVAVHVAFFRQELKGSLTFTLKNVPLR